LNSSSLEVGLMADRVAKAALFDGLVSAAKALSSGRRAEIVDVLAQGERSVEEIAAEIEQSVATPPSTCSTCSAAVSSELDVTAPASTTH